MGWHRNLRTVSGVVGYDENGGEADCDDVVLPIARNGGKLVSVLLLKPIGIDMISRMLCQNRDPIGAFGTIGHNTRTSVFYLYLFGKFAF